MTVCQKTLFLLLLVVIHLSACKNRQEPLTKLTLNVSSEFDINTMEDGQAAPLQIRLYELGSKTLFEQADFLDLYLQDGSTLQDSLIKKHPLLAFHPGERRKLTFKLDNATRYIAILAEFASYTTAVTRAVKGIKTGENNLLTLVIAENHLRLVSTPEKNGQ